MTGRSHARLAAIEIFDARAGQMQNRDDRLIGSGALFGQDRSEALAEIAKTPERIAANSDGPIDAGDDPPLIGAVRAIAEGRLGEIRERRHARFRDACS